MNLFLIKIKIKKSTLFQIFEINKYKFLSNLIRGTNNSTLKIQQLPQLAYAIQNQLILDQKTICTILCKFGNITTEQAQCIYNSYLCQQQPEQINQYTFILHIYIILFKSTINQNRNLLLSNEDQNNNKSNERCLYLYILQYLEYLLASFCILQSQESIKKQIYLQQYEINQQAQYALSQLFVDQNQILQDQIFMKQKTYNKIYEEIVQNITINNNDSSENVVLSGFHEHEQNFVEIKDNIVKPKKYCTSTQNESYIIYGAKKQCFNLDTSKKPQITLIINCCINCSINITQKFKCLILINCKSTKIYAPYVSNYISLINCVKSQISSCSQVVNIFQCNNCNFNITSFNIYSQDSNANAFAPCNLICDIYDELLKTDQKFQQLTKIWYNPIRIDPLGQQNNEQFNYEINNDFITYQSIFNKTISNKYIFAVPQIYQQILDEKIKKINEIQQNQITQKQLKQYMINFIQNSQKQGEIGHIIQSQIIVL